MAPFHPLRDETRAFAARVLASFAIFSIVSIVLLAGSAPGQIATAEAKKDKGAWHDRGDWGDEDAAPVAPTYTPDPEQQGHGNDDNGKDGKGWGGGGKSDPAEPTDPEAPPPTTTPTPPTDPAPAPNTGGEDGKGDDGGEDAEPTGAGGKGEGADPTPQPQVGNGNGTPDNQGGNPSTGTPPTTSDPTPPQAVSLGREGGAGSKRPNRIRFRSASTPVSNPGQVAGVGGTQAEFQPAPAAAAPAFERVGRAEGGGDGSANPTDRRARPNEAKLTKTGPPIIREIPRFVKDVPAALKFALAVTGVLSFLLAFAYLLTMFRARSLDRQRRDLLQEVGLLQSALLPPVPDRVGGLRTSVAYRPADGPGAGGDFYDVLPLPGGRVGFILGDVSGHGRGALARTAFMRYTLRAYLEAGLEPRVALQVAGRVIDGNLGGDFATVLLAVHDPETGSLTYATAGHPAPLVVGPQPHEPVTAGSSPPIGVGIRTGLRQTTVPLVPGSVAAMFTDGLLEARVEGGLLGRERLSELLDELGDDATARGLVDAVNRVSRVMSDDIAAVVIQPTNAATAGLFRTEQLELTARELDSEIGHRFLEACGVGPAESESALYDARMISDRFGGAILHVVFGNRLKVEVLPRNVESIEAASRRAAAVH
ncbi:MAG: two-component system, chemotaxis family, sensor kinase Cph1 [Thermoleophilaceae bacterium]|nr:two-component system, chemotaxis family, sensor kinase Cph1 [Thermoleophilaceae bacterium]